MSSSLAGRSQRPVCLVTGATSGIGLATALELARRGAHVVVHGRTPERAERARQRILEQLPTACVGSVSGDLACLAEVRSLAADVNARFAPLSTLHAAGPGVAPAAQPPLLWVLGGAALFGAAAGAIFGFAQWLVLRRHAYDARRWISANALGWALGLPWSYLAGSLADVSHSLAFAVFCAVIAGSLMGVSVAVVTGRTLTRLEPREGHAVSV